MTSIGIVTALGFEARASRHSPRVTVRRCGVAGAGIDREVRAMADQGVELVMSWGTAGALSSALDAGDLYLAGTVVSARGKRLTTDESYLSRLRAELSGRLTLRDGILVESPRIVGDPDEKRRLADATGAGAVDMESGLVGESCAALGLPFLSVRAIVDRLDDRLPAQIAECVDPAGSLHLARLITRVTIRPRDWMALIRLTPRYGRARATLASAAKAVASLASG